MEHHLIETTEDYQFLVNYVTTQGYKKVDVKIENGGYVLKFAEHECFTITMGSFDKPTRDSIYNWVKKLTTPSDGIDKLIFGKDETTHIVGCEVVDDKIELFIEKDGATTTKTIPNRFFIVAPRRFDSSWQPLKGNLYYRFIKYYDSQREFYNDIAIYKNSNIFYVSDTKEAAMLLNGFTYYKGMKVADVSALFFDIETTGLEHNNTSKVLLISNTFVKNGEAVRKLFACTDYFTFAEMITAWCDWVREVNPSVMAGHNIFGFDLPYLAYCADKLGATLKLGRDGSKLRFAKRESKFRKDGSQDYDYKRAFIYGREIVDTMFVAYRFDFSKKYESYGLKAIIKHEGLEVKNRVFYDASLIHKNYLIPEEWEKIKQYAIYDADDAWSLYKLMIPSYFYFCRSIPKTFQTLNYSATGSQLNALLIRSYLQDGHSLPAASEAESFQGAISIGNPGIYSHCWKIDVNSLYPSIILHYKICDNDKDPKQNFLKMVSYFTDERLENKRKGIETGDRYYKEMEQSQKIGINSSFGLYGAPGLLFNSPKNAARITYYGREILKKTMYWGTGIPFIEDGEDEAKRELRLSIKAHDFVLVGADTDSVVISKQDGSFFSVDERQMLLDEVNSIFPDRIKFSDDGYFERIVYLKAKNYILFDGKKIKIKGSSLKSSKTEKGLKCFMSEVIDCLVYNRQHEIADVYHKYIREVFNVTDISRWTSKKTVTAAVLKAARTTEKKILDALNGQHIQMGDKFYMYFTKDEKLKLQERWDNDHDSDVLLEKLYKTLVIFENVIDIKQYPKYHLVKNKERLREVLFNFKLFDVINET